MKKEMRNVMTGLVFAAALTALGSAAVFAEGDDTVQTQGIMFTIPEDIRDLVTVVEDEPESIVSVYETASVEAAKALGEDENYGAGWLFSISTITEDRLKELRCGGMEGMIVFAEDDDVYYVYNHPTDVRFVREQYEDIEEDQEQWTKVNEWASQEVRPEIVANNPELDAESYTNTELDMYLARAAYQPGTKYELRSVDFGPDPLDPSALGKNDYIEELAEDATYEILSDAEGPAGEYYVLAFDDDENVRFDFFKSEKNIIREVRGASSDEEIVTYYQANFKDADDDDTAAGIMEEWCSAIVNGDDDD